VSTDIFPSSPRRDLQGGVAWTMFGCIIAVLSWQMDRMVQQGATLHTAPGLWPGIVGTLLAVLGGVLMLRSWRRAQRIGWDAAEADDTDYAPVSSFALAAAMFFVYALLLVGRGLPFWLGTALFVAAGYFTLTFYDLFALRTIGANHVPYRIAAIGGFTSYSVGHNLGATVFTGGAIGLGLEISWLLHR